MSGVIYSEAYAKGDQYTAGCVYTHIPELESTRHIHLNRKIHKTFTFQSYVKLNIVSVHNKQVGAKKHV